MTTTANTTATVTINAKKYQVELEVCGDAEFQLFRVYEHGVLKGSIRPSAGLKGYWVWQTRGKARQAVAMRKGRAAAIRELITNGQYN